MDVGQRVIQRLTLTSNVVIVNALTKWTKTNFGTVQGLCIAIMTFIIATQLNQNQIQSRLIKQITLLYCNQQIRGFIVLDDMSPAGIFSNMMLAILLALITMTIYDRKKENDAKDLRTILEGLIYLYGDMFDFAFQYGVLKITVFAFGLSVFLRTIVEPTNTMQKFVLRLTSIISMNLLSQGTVTLTQQKSSQSMEIIECLASLAILRLAFPSMEGYLIYLTSTQLITIIPDTAPLLFCVILWLEMLGPSRQWLSETCITYIIISVCNFTAQSPLFWSMILISVLTHYADYIIESKRDKKQ